MTETQTPYILWASLRAYADLLEGVTKRQVTLDKRGWDQLSAELLHAATTCRVLGELQPPPLEVRNEPDDQ